MAENNSISTLLPQLLRLFNNSLENFEKVNQAITSDRESVTVNLQNENGTITRITVPSFGFLKNSVDRLDRNINTITNLSGGDSSIRLSDGTFRKLVLAKLPTEADDLTELNSINQFKIKPNWFFEELINPLLFVSFDITGQAPIDTERAIVRRYILDTVSQSQVNFYESEYNGRSDIDFNTFLQEIVEKNIGYVLDEAVVDLPPRVKRYSGKFSVIRISEIDFTEEVNGVQVTGKRKLYKLNKLDYTDSQADFPDTIGLKIGDSLEVMSDPIDTRYIVKQVDTSTNSVVLELVEGGKSILIGADVLKIGSNLNSSLNVDVTVGFDERCVTFIKPIDPNSKIPAVNWSPGSSFYTNDLLTVDSNGNQQSLSNFYQTTAVDFGRYLLSFAEDKIPTSKEGVTPNTPILNANDFKVTLVNGQVSNSNAIVELQDLNNQKVSLQANLKELDTAIAKKRTKLQTTNYATEIERDADKNGLRGLITDRSTQSELYSSVVKEIDSRGKDSSVASIVPKYRVRGFFPMPEEKSTEETGTQSIIKFKIRYRYLSEDGAANPVNQFKFTDGDGESQGSFSNYRIVETVVRPREKNNITGQYQWAAIDDSNADSININQLDIPIRKGEKVEIEIKSISEAGYPANPLESPFSIPVIVSFPSDLSSDNSIDSVLQQNMEDLAKVSLEEDLNAKGIDTHLSSAFISNEKYFAHTTNVISSGFLSENQTPIDLFTKLTQIDSQLKEFSEILRKASGELVVSMIDELGNPIKLNKESVTKIFAGFYSQEVQDLDDPRGAIISKTFFLNLANAEQTGLQLIARIAGNRGRMVKQSESPSATNTEIASGEVIYPATYSWLDNNRISQSDGRSTYTTNDSDYNLLKKYDLSPISLSNPTTLDGKKYGQIKSIGPLQSTQNKNQYIYCRFKDVSSEDVFYSYINPEQNYSINLDSVENHYGRNALSSGTNGFIWGGGFDGDGNPFTAQTYANTDDNTVEVHVTHPTVVTYNAYKSAYENFTGDTNTLPDINTVSSVDCTRNIPNVSNGTAGVLFRQSKFAPLKSDAVRGKQQAIYLNENPNDLRKLGIAKGLTFDNSQLLQASPTLRYIDALSNESDGSFVNYSRNAKNSFDTFDQYLLGKKSCGSYLFMAAADHENLQVSGDSVQSTKLISFGTQNSLNIPIVFQYRMTDYFGDGDGSSGGLGSIAGDSTGSTVNVTYAKKIGVDIYPTLNDVFQFDIEIFAKYRSDNLNLDVFPSATVSQGLGDLEKVIGQLNPSVTETKVNQIVKTGGQINQ
tara:strand:- start:73702 stop:77532 length:3831 start_codon:yes stop_codon:yes gene_type:complete